MDIKITPLRMAILYAVMSGIWIVFSDRLLAAIVTDRWLILKLSIAKGWFYVIVMAILLYLLFQKQGNSLFQTQKALQKDQEYLERYRLLAENVLDLILFINPEGQIIDANEAAVKRYGYTLEELTHMPLSNLRLPEDQLTVPFFLQNAPRGLQFELQHVCKDGSVFPIDISAKGATSNGKPIIVSIIRDITKRKNAEAAVWLEKERAQVTLESIGEAVITTDVQSNVEYLNPVAEKLTGWRNSEARGQPLKKVFHIVNEETGHKVLISRLGASIAIEESAATIRDRSEVAIGGVLVFRDVSYKRNLMKELAYQAQHDALTGLPNRLHFQECLKEALARAKCNRGRLAVMFLDLDCFKLINDTMGHNLGDQLLREVGKRIRQTLRGEDTIARQGGDEFLVLLPDIRDELEAGSIAERILGVFTHPILLDGNEVYMSTSIGISLYPNDGIEMEALVKQADTAMYYAKEQGKNNYQFFTEGLNLKAKQQLSTENCLRMALVRGEII
ncbi:MAG TPA: diguanylate cyclase [Desulfosporosinus sp.]|nr:diguanylate cyclase [Desulfosporosinus sp.]